MCMCMCVCMCACACACVCFCVFAMAFHVVHVLRVLRQLKGAPDGSDGSVSVDADGDGDTAPEVVVQTVHPSPSVAASTPSVSTPSSASPRVTGDGDIRRTLSSVSGSSARRRRRRRRQKGVVEHAAPSALHGIKASHGLRLTYVDVARKTVRAAVESPSGPPSHGTVPVSAASTPSPKPPKPALPPTPPPRCIGRLFKSRYLVSNPGHRLRADSHRAVILHARDIVTGARCVLKVFPAHVSAVLPRHVLAALVRLYVVGCCAHCYSTFVRKRSKKSC
jgi:hypothetical protein